METLGQGLGIIVAHSTSGEALPDRAGQVIQPGERARAINRGGHLVTKGHAFPFGLEARRRGGDAGWQSSAVARNEHFRLD
jgi:hypothetical protein